MLILTISTAQNGGRRFFGARRRFVPPKAFSNICCRSLRRRFNSFLIERLGGALKLQHLKGEREVMKFVHLSMDTYY